MWCNNVSQLVPNLCMNHVISTSHWMSELVLKLNLCFLFIFQLLWNSSKVLQNAKLDRSWKITRKTHLIQIQQEMGCPNNMMHATHVNPRYFLFEFHWLSNGSSKLWHYFRKQWVLKIEIIKYDNNKKCSCTICIIYGKNFGIYLKSPLILICIAASPSTSWKWYACKDNRVFEEMLISNSTREYYHINCKLAVYKSKVKLFCCCTWANHIHQLT